MGLEFKKDINPTEEEEGLMCPLVDFAIKKSDCLENTMIVAGFMDENGMIEKFKQKENWREICKKCPNHRF